MVRVKRKDPMVTLGWIPSWGVCINCQNGVSMFNIDSPKHDVGGGGNVRCHRPLRACVSRRGDNGGTELGLHHLGM